MARCNFAQGCKKKILLSIIILIIMSSMSAMGGLELTPKPVGKVTPEVGVLYSFNTPTSKALPDLYDNNFTYRLYIMDKTINLIKDNMTNVNLEIYNNRTGDWVFAGSSSAKNVTDMREAGTICDQPNSNASPIGSTQTSVNGGYHELTYNLSLSEILHEPFLGLSKYRLKGNDHDVIGGWEWYGPFIGVNIKNETAVRNGEYNYNYSAEIRVSKMIMNRLNNISVSICYKNKCDTNYSTYQPRYYDSTKEEWKKLEWNDAPPFEKLEFLVDLTDKTNF
jgi:hypothetical protein